MYEFTIVNNVTGEEEIIFGYNANDAFKRRKDLNEEQWFVALVDYID